MLSEKMHKQFHCCRSNNFHKINEKHNHRSGNNERSALHTGAWVDSGTLSIINLNTSTYGRVDFHFE